METKTVKLTDKSLEVLNYVKDNGGKVSTDELATALGRNSRSISASVTDLSTRKHFVTRTKVAGDGEDAKDVTFVEITPEGAAYVHPVDAE